VLTAVRNEAADAYEDNWLSLMASPDLAWEENSPFDEIPPQLGFVSRWHAKFIDIGEKLLFEVASRDSEHMSMIRQCFYELKGDKRDAACSIIRNGVMGMEVKHRILAQFIQGLDCEHYIRREYLTNVWTATFMSAHILMRSWTVSVILSRLIDCPISPTGSTRKKNLSHLIKIIDDE
jgi:hypothetical protein